MSELQIASGARVLFQGDSITDAGRIRGDDLSLGNGYANMIAAWLSARYPDRDITFINRGISGDRVYDLESRWVDDCLALQPDWLSIMIGINDTWRVIDSNLKSEFTDFEDCYRRLLDRVHAETSARVLLLEPFLLPTLPACVPMRADLDQRITVVRRIAHDYHAWLLPLDGLFAAVTAARDADFWSPDGVHPSQAGHALIAQAWIDMVTR